MAAAAVQTNIQHDFNAGLPAENVTGPKPAAIKGLLVWNGKETPGQHFIVELVDEDSQEIKSALKNVKYIPYNDISKSNFPLPNLERKLQEATLNLHQGTGYVILRGMDLGNVSPDLSLRAYLGVSSYIAEGRGRQHESNMLSHITSWKNWEVPRGDRHGIHTNGSLPFHNDMGCDILALHARDVATEGGNTYLSSAATVFNIMRDSDPELLAALMAPNWPVQTSKQDDYEGHHFEAPLFLNHGGQLMVNMDPERLGPHHADQSEQRPPPLSDLQLRAIGRVFEVANEVEQAVRLQKNDMLFFNNWALLHRRDAYKDGEDTTRHLVRLWLRNNELGWQVPDCMSVPWKTAYEQEVKDKVYPLNPPEKYIKPTNTAGSAYYDPRLDTESN